MTDLILLLVLLVVGLVVFLNYRLNTRKLRSKNVKVVRVIDFTPDKEGDDDFTRGAKEFYYRMLLELGPEQGWEHGKFFSTPSVADLGNTVFHKVMENYEQSKRT